MILTSNYGLKKPEGTDLVNVGDFNANADIIDEKLKETFHDDSSENTVTFNSGDSLDSVERPLVWSDVGLLASGEKHSSILNKISTMFKNIRYLYRMLDTHTHAWSAITDKPNIGGTTYQSYEGDWEKTELPSGYILSCGLTQEKSLNFSSTYGSMYFAEFTINMPVFLHGGIREVQLTPICVSGIFSINIVDANDRLVKGFIGSPVSGVFNVRFNVMVFGN